MDFNAEEENANRLRELIDGELPKENEIIIAAGGIIILDEEGYIQAQELGESVGDSVFCGC